MVNTFVLRDTIAKRVIEESEPKVLSQSNYLLDNSNTPDSSINDDFGYISDDSDRSTSLSSDGSLVSLCEGNEVQVQSFSAVESEKEILEEIDPHIPPWLRRVMDNDTFHRNNSNNTSKPSLRKHVAVAVQSSAAITGDELVKSFSPRDSISENRLLSEKESDVLQDWLDIPDEQLCNMMNSAERRYSLRQKYLLRSAVNREASAAKIIYHASASAESDFVDLLSSSSAATTKIEFNSPKLDPDNQHIPKEEVLHGNATLNSDEIELQLEIPPDFFGNNVCTEYNDIGLACHESAAQQIESFLSPFTPSKVKSANKYISYDFANYSSRKDEHNQSGINVKDEFPTVCSDVLCGQLASGAQPIFFVDLIDLNAASLSICVEFFELMEKSKCVSFDLVFRSVPSFDGLINSDLFQQPRHSKQNNIRNSWNCFIARNPTGPSGVKIIKGKESGGRSSSSIIAGAAIYFGGTSVFYLPLPCPLPLHKFCKNQDIVEQTATLSAMPIEVKILIIRLVGVDAQMNFCVNLSAVYYAVEAPFSLRHNSNEKKRAYSPLLLVSRGFNEACRQAMQEEWRRGCCTEWRILHKIMSSEHITKVGIYVKDQLAALRERDVMTNGFLEDPMIACQLLEIAETSLQMQDVRVTESSDLPISSNSIVSSRLLHAKREACLRAIRVMHIMGKLENELKTKNMMDLFFFVEMPLCNCVCEMEHSGMPFEASLFVNLKQDLSDRCKIIEHYFKLVEGKDFRMTSEKQIGKFKARLGRDILNQALERRGMNIDRHGGTFTGPMDKMFMLSKGLKDHPEEVTTEVATLMMTHPLIQLLSEWRSHSSALATIGSILCALPCKGEQTTSLGSRIRGYVNTIGAASGRMTVVRPPLQQMPHEVAYRPCRRQSVYAEACKAASDNRASVHVGIDVLNHKWNQNLEWVRITPIDRITSTGPFNFVSGKLIELCHDMIMEKSQEHQEIEIETKVKSIISVWRDHGHEYSDQDGRTIFVVKVSCSNPSNFENNYEISESQLWRTSNRSKHLVPADKVFRLSSPIEPHQDELDSISKKSNQEEAHHRDNFYRCVVSPRSGFVASKGFVIMSADYSQIELRILAHFCKDNALLKAFKEEKVDVFKSICSRWKKKAVELVSEEERDSVKQICYAIIYGAGASRISAVAGCTEIEAKYLYQDFLKCHPGVSKFISDVKKDSQKCGFVCTILGRRRHLNGIRSENKSIKAKAERQAVNTICQGSAADLIKVN